LTNSLLNNKTNIEIKRMAELSIARNPPINISNPILESSPRKNIGYEIPANIKGLSNFWKGYLMIFNTVIK
jgi:hypothetical protein